MKVTLQTGQRTCDEFAVSPSRLSDIETKGLVPSIFRLYSLAVIYQMDIRELLGFYGVDTALVDRERSDLGLTRCRASQQCARLQIRHPST